MKTPWALLWILSAFPATASEKLVIDRTDLDRPRVTFPSKTVVTLQGRLKRHLMRADGRRVFESETVYRDEISHHYEVFGPKGEALCSFGVYEDTRSRMHVQGGTRVVTTYGHDGAYYTEYDPGSCEYRHFGPQGLINTGSLQPQGRLTSCSN